MTLNTEQNVRRLRRAAYYAPWIALAVIAFFWLKGRLK